MYEVKEIEYKYTKTWITNLHYAKRLPATVRHSYGLYNDGLLVGVVIYSNPSSRGISKAVCGDVWKDHVLELSRLVLLDNKKNEASMLISASLKLLPRPNIIVSYSDTGWNHVGYVYQATNWLYTGLTAPRPGRTAKHRYVTFVGSRKEIQDMKSVMKYDVQPYPKGDSRRHEPTRHDLDWFKWEVENKYKRAR